MRSCFLRCFVGRAFSFAEVKFLESMDRYVATELVFKMCLLHHISNDEDALVLANHNVPRLVGLYQSLAFKVRDHPLKMMSPHFNFLTLSLLSSCFPMKIILNFNFCYPLLNPFRGT